jgi:hypothetical protein
MIGPSIFALLNGNSTITELSGSRITPGIIPQDQPVPCLYYGTDRIKPVPVRDNQGCFSGTLEVGYQVPEDSYDILETLTSAIRSVLDNYIGVSEGVSLSISAATQMPDDFDGELRYHGRSLEFLITGQILTS